MVTLADTGIDWEWPLVERNNTSYKDIVTFIVHFPSLYLTSGKTLQSQDGQSQ
jgi:hypothetical protein